MEGIKLKKVKLNREVRKDVHGVIKSIYRLNAKSAVGYLFNINFANTEVAVGMFCHSESEINDEWEYYYDFKTKTFYQVTKEK